MYLQNFGILVFAIPYYSSFFLVSGLPPTWDNNTLNGFKFISYTNFDGVKADGQCCDDRGQSAGSCQPDQCDTSFKLCLSRDSDQCDIINNTSTATTYNTSSIMFNDIMGNGVNKSTNFFVYKLDYKNQSIHYTITAVEKPEQFQMDQPESEIAKFRFVVDWVDPIYKDPPNYTRFVLNDTRAQLVMDLFSQCRKYYYTSDCSVYCKPDIVHYNCLDNGTKQCLPGWEGPDCLNMTDCCPDNRCQHGSTCVPIHLSYTCMCSSLYTGSFCESSLMDTSTEAWTRNNTADFKTVDSTTVMTRTTSINTEAFSKQSKTKLIDHSNSKLITSLWRESTVGTRAQPKNNSTSFKQGVTTRVDVSTERMTPDPPTMTGNDKVVFRTAESTTVVSRTTSLNTKAFSKQGMTKGADHRTTRMTPDPRNESTSRAFESNGSGASEQSQTIGLSVGGSFLFLLIIAAVICFLLIRYKRKKSKVSAVEMTSSASPENPVN